MNRNLELRISELRVIPINYRTSTVELSGFYDQILYKMYNKNENTWKYKQVEGIKRRKYTNKYRIR
ncbi:hypothetical protein NEPAR08_1783 [Nematocida parisii]|nr:hypothetical protein NEPAR08_1783 [Nematocida parisii]